MQKRALASMAALTLGLTACGPAVRGFVPTTNGVGSLALNQLTKGGSRDGAKWTVMVHLAADNNLYRFGLEDLNEMEAGLNSPDVNIIVLFDGAKQGDSAIYKIKKDPAGKNSTIISDIVNDGGAIIPAGKEIDSGDPRLSAKFLAWAAKAYPAQNYAAFFWDHGSGIFGLKNRSFPTKGFAWDDNGTHMKTSDVGPLLGAGAQVMGKPFEAYGFDACLMAHVEMAYQAKGVSNFLVASEELEPGAGWDYDGWVKALSANPTMNGAGLGKAMVKSYIDSYKPGGSQNPGGRAVEATLSAVDINALVRNFVPANNAFASALSGAYTGSKAALDGARSASVTFDNTDCADFGDFLSNLNKASVPANVKAAADSVNAAYKSAVVANGGVGSPSHEKATGLVVYFPRPDQAYNPIYSDPSKIAYGSENWKQYLLTSHGK